MRHQARIILTSFALLCFLASCSNQSNNKSGEEGIGSATVSKSKTIVYKNYHIAAKKLIKSGNLNERSLRITINKKKYLLSLFAKDELLKEYPVVFGRNDNTDKLMEGDRCTPEGEFKVRSFYPHKSWSKFIWIDYPTQESWKKHKLAKQNKQIPADANIGGEIGIHGVPKGREDLIDDKTNWTLGCISLKNKDINDLYTIVFEGMEIFIK